MFRFLARLHSVAKFTCSKYHPVAEVKKAPAGTVCFDDKLYMDFGGITRKLIGDKLIEVPYCSNGIEVIVTHLGASDDSTETN